MSRPVVIVGAGATKACGGPLTNEILPKAFELYYAGDADIQREDYIHDLDDFLIDHFHVPVDRAARSATDYPALPLLLALLDTALDRGHPIGGHDGERLARVRAAVDYVIFAVLELSLRDVEPHYDELLDLLYGSTGTEPDIISLNYDIIADNALKELAERTGRGPAYPEYGCDLASEFYRSSRRWGRLLKLHGSLNWMYCPSCNRLDLAVSEPGGSTVKMLEELYVPVVELDRGYSCHGSRCAGERCSGTVRPVMITPTHMKDYRNPHVGRTWYEAEQLLRRADRAVFVGYSLPENDVDVIYLLKRGLSHLSPEQITVVEWDDDRRPLNEHPTGQWYRTLFGNRIDWHPEGFADWLQIAAGRS